LKRNLELFELGIGDGELRGD